MRKRYSRPMRVGFVGAGRMGRPMVDRLVAAGHAVTVLRRTAQAREALLSAGARPVAAASSFAGDADVVLVVVFTRGWVAQGVRLGEQLGGSGEALLAALPNGSAASRGLSVAAGRGSVATSARMLAEFLGKDVKVVREVAADLGVTLGVLDAAIAELEALTAS